MYEIIVRVHSLFYSNQTRNHITEIGNGFVDASTRRRSNGFAHDQTKSTTQTQPQLFVVFYRWSSITSKRNLNDHSDVQRLRPILTLQSRARLLFKNQFQNVLLRRARETTRCRHRYGDLRNGNTDGTCSIRNRDNETTTTIVRTKEALGVRYLSQFPSTRDFRINIMRYFPTHARARTRTIYTENVVLRECNFC